MAFLIKSRKKDNSSLEESPKSKPRSFAFDPRIVQDQHVSDIPSERHPGTAGLPYDTCLAVARIPVIGAMIHTRTSQAAEFSKPQPDPYSVGFVIKKKGDNSSSKPNNRDLKRIQTITEIVTRAGGPYWPGGFDAFLRTIVPDSLTYDQVNFEVIRDVGGKPWGFVPVDPRTIRRGKPTSKEVEAGRIDPYRSGYVQFIDQKIVREFDYYEMAWGIRRPRSDSRVNGYGWPEPEELLGTITNLLNAETFNAAKFNNGIAPRMILGVKSAMDSEMWDSFQRQVWATLNGVAAHGRVPMIQLDPEFKEDIVNVGLNNEAAEMEYREWVNWLLKIVCAVYLIDPAEIGFVFGNEGQGSGLQNSSAADRVSMSREKGLYPLMRSIAYWINEWVIDPFDDDFMLEFVGFNADTEEQRNKLDETAVQYFETIDEVRARRRLDPLPNGMGKILLNGIWMQHYQAEQDRKREEELALNEFNSFMNDSSSLPEMDMIGDSQPGGDDTLGGQPQGGESLMASSFMSKGGYDPRVSVLARLDNKTVAMYDEKLGWMLQKIKKAMNAGS